MLWHTYTPYLWMPMNIGIFLNHVHHEQFPNNQLRILITQYIMLLNTNPYKIYFLHYNYNNFHYITFSIHIIVNL